MIHWLAQSQEDIPHTKATEPSIPFLNGTEELKLASLPTRKRRGDWLLGRWTAKRLLQTIIWETKNTTVPLDLITVSNNLDGVPMVRSQLPMINGKFSISISHSNGHALVTAVAKPDWSIGCDLELIRPRNDSFIGDYFTETEALLVRQAKGKQRDALVTAVWSAKEAVLKALHLGLSVDTRAISCLIDPEKRPSDNWVRFKIRCDNNRLPKTAPRFSGWWRTMDQFVMTLVTQQ